MFGIGPMELIVVAVVAIVVVGPKRLPEAMRKMGKMFVQLRRQTHEIRQGFNDVVRDAERELELDRIRELKEQVDKLRDTSSIKSKINEHINLDDDHKDEKAPKSHSREYHDSHYVDGEYTEHTDGFVDTDSLLAKAKEIEDAVLRPKTDDKEEQKTSEDSAEPGKVNNADEAAPMKEPSAEKPKPE